MQWSFEWLKQKGKIYASGLTNLRNSAFLRLLSSSLEECMSYYLNFLPHD